jgi:hypothetical protein
VIRISVKQNRNPHNLLLLFLNSRLGRVFSFRFFTRSCLLVLLQLRRLGCRILQNNTRLGRRLERQYGRRRGTRRRVAGLFETAVELLEDVDESSHGVVASFRGRVDERKEEAEVEEVEVGKSEMELTSSTRERHKWIAEKCFESF